MKNVSKVFSYAVLDGGLATRYIETVFDIFGISNLRTSTQLRFKWYSMQLSKQRSAVQGTVSWYGM
jgi:rare lipoprotein A (peptidoglycan hydrolase)